MLSYKCTGTFFSSVLMRLLTFLKICFFGMQVNHRADAFQEYEGEVQTRASFVALRALAVGCTVLTHFTHPAMDFKAI